MARIPKPSGRKRRDRSLGDIARKSPFRQARKRILIVCEGEKTEPNYFNTFKKVFRLTSVDVLVESGNRKTSPKQIIGRAINRKAEDSDLDEVWCVFDKEISDQIQEIEDARKLAGINGIKIAVSNPGFEFWCLLHYEFTTRPFSSSRQLITVLKRHIPEYDKSLKDCRSLIELLEIAETNAQRVLESHKNTHYAPNPSTYVHQLTQRLKKLDTE